LFYPLFCNDRIKQQDVVCYANPHWTFHIAAIFTYSWLRTVIAKGPTHCLKGELASSNVAIHLRNYRLFWPILIKPNRTTGEAYMDSSLIIANDDLEPIRALLMANNSHW
jgi:hypothetical protein